MKLVFTALFLSLLTGCVVYNDGTDTGIITPLGATSTADNDEENEA